MAEHLTVDQAVEGSTPFAHPDNDQEKTVFAVFYLLND